LFSNLLKVSSLSLTLVSHKRIDYLERYLYLVTLVLVGNLSDFSNQCYLYSLVVMKKVTIGINFTSMHA